MAPSRLRIANRGLTGGSLIHEPRCVPLLIWLSLLGLALISCSEENGKGATRSAAGTPGTATVATRVISHLSYPFHPMFTLTPFDPTATPAQRPIQPLARGVAGVQDATLPSWIESVWPAPGSAVLLDGVENICIRPASIFLHELYPQLLDIFNAGERARDHLKLQVNGVAPSELTWRDIIRPNSNNPGTAWIGTWTYNEFCWPAELAAGRYQVRLSYPDGQNDSHYNWTFTTREN
jgi:hypothetical protein